MSTCPDPKTQAVESFACPTCHAPAGQRCETGLGLPTIPHRDRERELLHEIQDQVRAAYARQGETT